jgi:C-terminal domain on Strawberry notch homologue
VIVISVTPVRPACSAVHAASQGCEGFLKLWSRPRRRFLNRLLSLPCARQNLLFNYFAATLAAEIRAAKAEGRYFEGMSELAGVPKLKQVPAACLCMLRCITCGPVAGGPRRTLSHQYLDGEHK